MPDGAAMFDMLKVVQWRCRTKRFRNKVFKARDGRVAGCLQRKTSELFFVFFSFFSFSEISQDLVFSEYEYKPVLYYNEQQ